MSHNYTLKIAGSTNLERGVYMAAIFKNKIELAFFKDGEVIKTASLSSGQTNLSNSLQKTKDKVALFCQRLGIEEQQLEYDHSEINKVERLVCKALSLGRKIFDVFLPAQWVIVYKKENDKKWQKIVPNSKVFQADPFIIYKDNKYYVFYEELKFSDWHGYLMVAELDIENARLINEKIILKKDYHLSYPNIFKENGIYYMIPEAMDSHSVDLYECTCFPYEWKKKRTLLENIQAVDTTPLKTDQGWYLFTSEVIKGAVCNDELSIYKSSDLLKKPFEKLYKTPVVSDVTNARMGGHFIQKNGEVYRISQNCGKRYGYQANINKILQIEGGYKEEIVETLKADFSALSFHTYNQDHDIMVGDMEIFRFDWYSLKRSTFAQLKRLIKGASLNSKKPNMTTENHLLTDDFS